MPTATLHDGSTIEVHVQGTGPAVLLPVDPVPLTGPQADEMRAWGGDPALGHNLVTGLADDFRVIAADLEGHLREHPQPDTLTPDNLARDLLAIADAAGADRFAYYGYSWLAVAGLQLALRTDRLTALVMGGYPPVDGPYAEMLKVTRAAHEMTVAQQESPVAEPADVEPGDWSNAGMAASEAQTRQFLTLYEALQNFDDHAALEQVSCPRMCFAGTADRIDYDEKWGGVRVDIVGPLLSRRALLEDSGWMVWLLDGLDHLGAMQADNMLPMVRSWLAAVLPR